MTLVRDSESYLVTTCYWIRCPSGSWEVTRSGGDRSPLKKSSKERRTSCKGWLPPVLSQLSGWIHAAIVGASVAYHAARAGAVVAPSRRRAAGRRRDCGLVRLDRSVRRTQSTERAGQCELAIDQLPALMRGDGARSTNPDTPNRKRRRQRRFQQA